MKRYYSAFVLGPGFTRTNMRLFGYARYSHLAEAVDPLPLHNADASAAYTNLESPGQLGAFFPERVKFVTISPLVDEVVEFLSAASVRVYEGSGQRMLLQAPLAHLLGTGVPLDLSDRQDRARDYWWIGAEVSFEDPHVNERLRSYLASPYGSLLATLAAASAGLPAEAIADGLRDELRVRDAARRLGAPGSDVGLQSTRFWGWLIIEGT